jgi:hypothetical protein
MLAVFGVVGFFLVTEHRAHLFGILPFLLLLALPLLLWFMHGGKPKHRGEDWTTAADRISRRSSRVWVSFSK